MQGAQPGDGRRLLSDTGIGMEALWPLGGQGKWRQLSRGVEQGWS